MSSHPWTEEHDPYLPRYRRPEPHTPAWPLIVLLVLVLCALGAVAWWLWPRHGQVFDQNARPREVTPAAPLLPEEKVNIDVFTKAKPSVVHITSLTNRRVGWTRNVQQVPEGTGSGIVWDDQGHIVTNFHVIKNADAAEVVLSDGTKYAAHWVGGDPNKDIAVLWIEAPRSKLRPIDIGSSHDLQVGQFAFAIGNPFGLDHSFSRGIISALNREIESVTHKSIKNVIQTDAAINPGNSGGPLLDRSARLIGMNTAIYSPSGASAGIGFAIPVDIINRVVPDLIAKKQPDQGPPEEGD